MKLTIFVRADLAAIAKSYPNRPDAWVAAAFAEGSPMGGWNLTTSQAADEDLIRKCASDSYPLYPEVELIYPDEKPSVEAA
ncbi:hypothetical protein [Roseateles terrae]|uniref:Uncharacterized protein n=1 Tax=Roseateles terrae TaxID=431060 RepID=A0ABR6GPC7_9BURK|nr:hypothetical protein [Roseateles terrae]MBB3193927.1 hypothetical protein [Roseateles terrae]OWQ87805.1 hypothetical protein CDN98_06475 [Roseateles terrae]